MNDLVSIIGCGWLGIQLGNVLAEHQYQVKGSTTTREKIKLLSNKNILPFCFVLGENSSSVPPALFHTSVVIVTVPPSANNYSAAISMLIHLLQRFNVKKVIFVSSTAVYPNLNRMVTEDDATNIPTPRSGVKLLEIEELFRGNDNFQSTILRLGGLYGPGREAGRFLHGRVKVTGAEMPVNLLHLDDAVGVIETILKKDLWGETLNVVAPAHPTKRLFYTKACHALGLKAPDFSADETPFKIVSSEKLLRMTGYEFVHPDPMDDLVGK